RRLALEAGAELHETPLHHLEVGEDQLFLQPLCFARGIRGITQRRGREPPHDVEERVGVPQVTHVEPGPLAPLQAAQVHDVDGGVYRPLGPEEGAEPSYPLVGDSRHADVERSPRDGAGDRLGAGEKVEQRGLAALRKADDPELHDPRVYTRALTGPGP